MGAVQHVLGTPERQGPKGGNLVEHPNLGDRRPLESDTAGFLHYRNDQRRHHARAFAGERCTDDLGIACDFSERRQQLRVYAHRDRSQ